MGAGSRLTGFEREAVNRDSAMITGSSFMKCGQLRRAFLPGVFPFHTYNIMA